MKNTVDKDILTALSSRQQRKVARLGRFTVVEKLPQNGDFVVRPLKRMFHDGRCWPSYLQDFPIVERA